MTVEWDQDSDDSGSWFETDTEDLDGNDDPTLPQMIMAIESEMEDTQSVGASEHDESRVATPISIAHPLREPEAHNTQSFRRSHHNEGTPRDPSQLMSVAEGSTLEGNRHWEMTQHGLMPQPTFAGSLPPPTLPPRTGHVFFPPSELPIPDSPESPPLSEQGQFDDADDTSNAFVVETTQDPIPPTPVTSPIPWEIVPDSELNNKCVFCGTTYWDALLEAASAYEAETSYPWERADQKLVKRNAFIMGLRSQAAFIIRGGVSQVATCDGTAREIFSTGYTISPMENGPSPNFL